MVLFLFNSLKLHITTRTSEINDLKFDLKQACMVSFENEDLREKHYSPAWYILTKQQSTLSGLYNLIKPRGMLEEFEESL